MPGANHQVIKPGIVLHTIWVLREGCEEPELWDAWDENTYSDNREGYEIKLREAYDAIGDGLTAVRELELALAGDIATQLRELFEPARLTVSGALKPRTGEQV